MSDSNSFQWYGGYDEECVWLKFGVNPDWILSMVRCWDTQSIELAIRLKDAASTKIKIPGYAPFSIEAGTDESIVSIDGTGMLEKHPKGKVVFRAGNMDFDDPYSLFTVRRWLTFAKPPLVIHIGQLEMPFPVDSSIFSALSALSEKQRSFQTSIHSHALYFAEKV